MIKESNMSIFSIMLGLLVVFFNISGMLTQKYNIIIAVVSATIAIIALVLSIINKKKFKSKRDKYIFSITISIISVVFNLFLLVSLGIFMTA